MRLNRLSFKMKLSSFNRIMRYDFLQQLETYKPTYDKQPFSHSSRGPNDLPTLKLQQWPMTGSRSSAEASGIQHMAGHFAAGYWRIIIWKWRCDNGLFHCIYGTLRILYGTISHERLFSLIVDKIDWKYAWTIRLDNLDRAQQNSRVQAQNFQQQQEYSGREGNNVNLLLPHQKSASLKTRLKTSSRSLFSEKSKNPFIVETYNCTRLLAVKKKTNKTKENTPQPCRPHSRIYCCLMYHSFYFYSEAAVTCMKSKPPSTLFWQSCRWDLRLLPTEPLPSLPPPTLYSSQNIYFSYDCLKHSSGIHNLSSADDRLFQFVLILSPTFGIPGPHCILQGQGCFPERWRYQAFHSVPSSVFQLHYETSLLSV